MKRGNYINGEWVKGEGEVFESRDPFTNGVIWKGERVSSEQLKRATAVAQESLVTWSSLTLEERLAPIQRYGEILGDSNHVMAQLISQEVGKPLWESLTEVKGMVNKITISINAYSDRCRELSQEFPGKRSLTRHRPHGVMAVLGPYNFPGHLPNGHIVPALIAGNTIVFKPSSYTPQVAAFMVDCWDKAGLPEGALNLVQGSGAIGESLAGSSDVQGILFTGSFGVGSRLTTLLASQPNKLLALEMGGNNPLIVSNFDDEQAACYTVIQSAYLTSGQRCTGARRLILIESQETESLLERLLRVLPKINVGHYSESPEPFMGPVISQQSATTLLTEQDALIHRGAIPLCPMVQNHKSKALLTPGLLDVTSIDRHDNELFGPLLQVVRVSNLEEAVKEANHTEYGLSSSILTRDRSEYDYLYSQSRAGLINWNLPTNGASSSAPFGGTGKSGNFRPSAYYAADYCAYPVASLLCESIIKPKILLPGLPDIT